MIPDLEIWAVIQRAPRYEISCFGRCRNKRIGKIRKPQFTRGYPVYGLADKTGRLISVFAHCAVLEAFVGSRPNGCEAAHGDGNKLNVFVGNLRWATPAENLADKYLHGNIAKGERIGTAKLTDVQAKEIRRLGKATKSVAAIAREVKQPYHRVYDVLRGNTWGYLK